MITLSVRHLRTLAQKSVGVIGARKIEPTYFTTRWGIHTFGVLYPIDVVILDTNNRVIALSRELRPNRIFFWNPKYFHVVELPPGEITKRRITLGAQIQLLFL